MSGGLEHYKQIEQRVKALEKATAQNADGITRLMELHAADRVDLDKLLTVLYGDKRMGLVGLLDRLRETETALMRGRLFTNLATIGAAALNFAILIFLIVKLS